MYILRLTDAKQIEQAYFMNCCCVTPNIKYACKFSTLNDANKAKEDYSYLGSFVVEEI